MKKIVVLMFLLVCLTSVFAGSGSGDDPIRDGFFLNFPISIYPSNYLGLEGVDLPDEQKFLSYGIGIEFGTMFQLTDLASDDMGLGIRVIWFGAGGGIGSKGELEKQIVNASALSPGVYFSKAINDNAIDLFIHFVPTFAAFVDDEFNMGYGDQWKIGSSFRVGQLMLGLDYNLGLLKFELDGGYPEEAGGFFLNGNYLRITAGLKF